MKSRLLAILCLLCLPLPALGQTAEDFDSFSWLDLDHDAKLSRHELAQLYPGLDPTLFTAADQDGDGKLSALEFRSLFSGIALPAEPGTDYELRPPSLPQLREPSQAQAGVKFPQQPVAPSVSGPKPPVVEFFAPSVP